MPDTTRAPILTAHLFEELDARLIELLESLSPDEWQQSTIVPGWEVRHIAAHLLDTATRRLSLVRDQVDLPAPAITSVRDLGAFINRLNAEGVAVYGRLSPRMLIAFLRLTLRELHDYLLSLDPMAPTAFAVSWAGEDRSLNWFDMARELTERWHHKEQIRLAVDRPGIMTPRLYGPVLACFMRGLPHAYRDVKARPGDVAEIRVTGDCGGTWCMQKTDTGWSLVDTIDRTRIVATTTIPQELAWRIFTKGISPTLARTAGTIDGDEEIGSAVLRMISIVA